MQPVGREHAPSRLLAHQRKEVDPARPRALALGAGDLVESLDLARDGRHVAEFHRRRRHRPIRLRERDDSGPRRMRAKVRVDACEALAITVGAHGANDVVRADQDRHECRSHLGDERQLLGYEVVGRVTVDRGVCERDAAPRFAPQPDEDSGERALR